MPIGKPRLGTRVNWANGLTRSLAGLWLFNEQDGNLVQDVSSRGANGSLLGTHPPIWGPESAAQQDPCGAGLTFNTSATASNSYVDAGLSPSVTNLAFGAVTTTWFIRFLINPTNGNMQPLCEKNDANAVNIGWLLAAGTGSGSNGIVLFVNEYSSNNSIFTISPNIKAGAWANLVWTFTSLSTSATGASCVGWVNGVSFPVTVHNAGSGTAGSDIAQHLYIGRNSYSEFGEPAGIGCLDGVISTLGIWNRALSQAEIYALQADPWAMMRDPDRPRTLGLPVPKVITMPAPSTWTPHAVYAPDVAGPLSVPSVPSQQAVYAPTVMGGAQEIDPPLPITWTPRNVYSPTVAGPLLVNPVPSLQAVYAPTVTATQTLSPAAVPSQQSVPGPTVLLVQVIAPAKVPSQQAVFAPTMRGSTQYINLATCPSQQSVPTPTITGGALQGIQIFVGGVDVTANYLETCATVPSMEPALGSGSVASGAIITSQTIGRWQCTLKLFDMYGVLSIALAQTVLILDYGQKLFAGCVQMVTRNRELSTSSAITFEITATDKSGICDHRVVTGTPDYPAGSDTAQTILSIVGSYLNGEGITTDHIPTDGSLGTLVADIAPNFWTVTQMFDQIASDNGFVWFVDVNGELYFKSFATFPGAPFSLTETSQNYRALAITQNLLQYRNKQYAVSNLNTLPGAGSGGGGGSGGGSSTAVVTETYTWGVGNPGIQSQYIGGVLTAVGINLNLPIDTVQSITVNSAVQTVYELSNFSGQTSTGPTDHLWSYLSQNDPNGINTVADHQVFPEILLTTGQTVVVNYVPASANAAAENGTPLAATPPPGAPTVGGLGTCGSGVYEAVEQVQNISSQASLYAVAVGILSRYGSIPTQVNFQTDYPGLRPGQLLTVDIPLMFQETAQFLITQVQLTHMSANVGAGMSNGAVNSSFRCDVSSSSILDPGNWIKWYENLIARTQNPTPVYQYEEANFQLGGTAGNLSGGVVATNPYIVKRTGLLFDMHAAAQTTPVNQNLILSFKVNNIPIGGQVVIGGGSTANMDNVSVFPTTEPLYVFARPPNGPNDVITIVATYQVTGPGPVNAVGVTAFLRWRI
jgi:Concanavalin A-like lectin/glucanases superfamily